MLRCRVTFNLVWADALGDDYPFSFVVQSLPLFGIIALVVIYRLMANHFDRWRIRNYVEQRGGHILDITWNPFGRGWFGSRNERIYDVSYHNRSGALVAATCKTSLLSGVYWTSHGEL